MDLKYHWYFSVGAHLFFRCAIRSFTLENCLSRPARIPSGVGFYRRIEGYGMYTAAESYTPIPKPLPRSYLN